ncbi:MAG: IclR family transcriptional regulator [Anaerolineales bacterium]|nr:IclR family transcriptional regulator [Anaerolineales bacterium]
MRRREAITTKQTHQSLQRAVAIMRVFSEEHPTLSVGEISERLELHKSTVSRILAALREEELVELDLETGRYRLGVGLVTLAGVALGQITVRGTAYPLMEQLAQQTQETCSLWVLRENNSVCVAHIPAPQSIRYVVWTGRRVPLTATASGKVLLAGLAPHQRRALLQLPLPARTPHTITGLDQLEEVMAKTAVSGHALEIDEFETGTSAIAVPIFNHTGHVAAALSIAGPTYRLHQAQLTALASPLQTQAFAISSRLGFGGNYPFTD